MHFKSKPVITTTIAAIAFTALSGFSGLATAQSATPGTPAPAAPSQSADQTDENTVQTFAVALAAVKDVQIEYIEKIKAANEPEAANQLQQEAQSKMVNAVETKGLSVNQYNSLAQQMQADPGFRQRVERAMPK
jgi:hypothetical protein